MHKDTPKITTGRRSPSDVSEVEVERTNQVLIKAHGNATTTVSQVFISISLQEHL